MALASYGNNFILFKLEFWLLEAPQILEQEFFYFLTLECIKLGIGVSFISINP